MRNNKAYTLFRKTKTTGCVQDDESDTRKTETNLILVPTEELDSFYESMAEDYGYQDYSYQVSYKEVATFYKEELEQLVNLLGGL